MGIDVVFNAGMDHLSKKGGKQAVSVEDCISKGVFGTNINVFTSFRKESQDIKNHEDSYIKATNNRLKKEDSPHKIICLWIGQNNPSRHHQSGVKGFSWIHMPAMQHKEKASTRMSL